MSITRFRTYEPEPMSGTKVENWTRASVRHSLVGRRIEWRSPGWSSKHSGVVEETRGMGKNVLVSGNHEWAPDMLDVHVLPEEV